MSLEALDTRVDNQDAGLRRVPSTSALSVDTFTSTGLTEYECTEKLEEVDKMIDEEKSETGKVSDILLIYIFVTLGGIRSIFLSNPDQVQTLSYQEKE